MLLFITVKPYRAWHLGRGRILIRLCIHAARYICKLMCHAVRTQGTVLLYQNSTSIVTHADRVPVKLHTTALPLPAVKKHPDKIQITVLHFFLLTPTRLRRWNRQCSETSAYKIQTSEKHPKERILQITDLRGNIISEQTDAVLDLPKEK
jgi:hypothetical protein